MMLLILIQVESNFSKHELQELKYLAIIKPFLANKA